MDKHLFFENAYFIIGTSYAGKSTMVKALAPEFDKEKASPEGPEMPKYKANRRKAKEIKNAQFMDNM